MTPHKSDCFAGTHFFQLSFVPVTANGLRKAFRPEYLYSVDALGDLMERECAKEAERFRLCPEGSRRRDDLAWVR